MLKCRRTKLQEEDTSDRKEQEEDDKDGVSDSDNNHVC